MAASCRRAGGTNSFNFDPGINLTSYNGGTFEADSGSLILNGNNSYYTNGAFNVASNASVVWSSPGQSSSFAGDFNGLGGGAVAIAGGDLSIGTGGADLDLPGTMLQWSGGVITADNPLTNSGHLEHHDLEQRDLGSDQRAGQLRPCANKPAPVPCILQLNSVFNNLATGTYDLTTTDAGLSVNDYSPQNFNNYGVFEKTARRQQFPRFKPCCSITTAC